MNDEFEAFLNSADAQADRDTAKARPSKTQQKFPCGQCHGTGRYQGARVHQPKSECFACRGTGFFKTDPRKLADRRAASALKKTQKLDEALAGFKAAHPDLYKELHDARTLGSNNGFICSLSEGLFKYGSLTENQVAVWYRGKAKMALIVEAREEEKKRTAVEVDLTPIRTMFETAVANGYKKPVYRAEGLVITRAPNTGSNPGALYIKGEGGFDAPYFGKILGTTFQPTREGHAAGETLTLIAKDPLEAALRYGRRTGNCACCGRLLTNHTSIDAGIGPICKAKWGL